MSESSRFVTDPARLRQLRAERFVPWPLADLPSLTSRGHHDPMDSSTWGWSCGRGWVRDERFGSGQVIPGKPRKYHGGPADSEATR